MHALQKEEKFGIFFAEFLVGNQIMRELSGDDGDVLLDTSLPADF